jgi:hypothetical protein
LVERTVGDQVFSDIIGLINWSNANLGQLRNNNDPITSTNPWNRSVAQVGSAPNIQIYQWDGENLPSSFPTESPWTLRDRVQTDQEIVDAIGRVDDVNLVDDAEKTLIDSQQSLTGNSIPQKTASGFQDSPLSVSSTMVESTMPLKLPGGGALQFDNNDMSSGGTVSGGASGVRITNLSDDTEGYLPSVPFDEQTGSDRPFYDDDGIRTVLPIQSPAGTVIRNAEFDFINPLPGRVGQYTVRRPDGSPTLTDCNFIIWLDGYNTGTPLFDYKESNPGGGGFTLQAGLNTITPPVRIGFPANIDPTAAQQIRLYSHVVDSAGNLVQLVGSLQDFPPPPDPRSENVWIPDLGRVVYFSNKKNVADLNDAQRQFVSVGANQSYTTRDQLKAIRNALFSFTAASTVTIGNAIPFEDGQSYELHGNGAAGTFALTGITIEGQANYTVANGDQVVIHIDDASSNTARVESLNRNTEAGSATKRYNDVEYRRGNFTLGLTSTDTNPPGNLYRVEQTATVTLPASTNDDQLGSHWGVQNASPGETVTYQADTSDPGHTVVLEGFTRPYDQPSGESGDWVMVDRTANSTNYRYMNQVNGIEGLMSVHAIVGTTGNIFGISGRPVHYRNSTAGTANFTRTIAGVGLLPRNESCRLKMQNIDTTYGMNVMVPSGMTFADTNTRLIAIAPGDHQWFTITHLSDGTFEVAVDGPIEYKFMIASHDITNTGDNKGDWAGSVGPAIPSYLSEVIFSPTLLAERDRLEAGTDAGFLLEFNFMATVSHGSGNSGDFNVISVRGDLNDGNPFGPLAQMVARGGTGAAQLVFDINRTWMTPMNGGNHFNLTTTGFPVSGSAGARLLNPWAHVTVTIKR